MEYYRNRNGRSGVRAYEIGNNFIIVQFSDSSAYEYTYSVTGPINVENMKQLAINGQGLNSFINRYVKYNYSRKLR